jgi:hypothetical protein
MKAALILSALVTALPVRSSGQALRVRLTEEGTGRPAAGALVSLRTSPDSALVWALTDQGGRAVLRAPRAGSYLVRFDRIGYRGAISGPVRLTAGDTLLIELTAPDVRVSLAELSVTSNVKAVCRLTDEAGELASTLWTEARKALLGAELSETRLPLLEVTRFERGYAPGSAIVEEKAIRFRTDSVPFVAADPKRLAGAGYLERTGGATTFYAPDGKVLLSDEFLAQHCFRPVDSASDSSLIGLGFSPLPDRNKPDVHGTLWLERETSELRYLEFEFTGLGKAFQTGNEGGRVDFVRLPDGRWLVGKWRARVAWHERGGEVALVGPDGTTPRGAILAGSIYDSLAGRPLAGAVVTVGGGTYADTTGEDGTYRLEIPTEGQFAVGLAHPTLALFGLAGPGRSTAVIRGQEVRLDFAIPGPEALIGRVCPGWEPAEGTGVLVGQAADSAGDRRPTEIEVSWDGQTLLRPGYRTSISEHDYRIKVGSDLDGRFHLCGVPAEVDLRLGSATRPAAPGTTARLKSGGIAVALVRLP